MAECPVCGAELEESGDYYICDECNAGYRKEDVDNCPPDGAEEIWLSSGMDEDYDFR